MTALNYLAYDDDQVDWDEIYSLADRLESELKTNPDGFNYRAGLPSVPWNREALMEELRNEWSIDSGVPAKTFVKEFKRKWFEDLAEFLYLGYLD